VDARVLSKGISIEEIKKSINYLQNDKTPGVDRLIAKFY
jgi:hypothetical protein